MVTADETGWRVGARGHWLWAAVTPTTTIYAICAGRGFEDAQAVLGADFDGVLVRDGWVVYRRPTASTKLVCNTWADAVSISRTFIPTVRGPAKCTTSCRPVSRCATGATPAV